MDVHEWLGLRVDGEVRLIARRLELIPSWEVSQGER